MSFQEWVEEIVKRYGGWRKAAAAVGVSHATLMKAAGHIDGGINLETLQAIARLAGCSLSHVIYRYTGDVEPDELICAELEVLRQKHPELVDALHLAVQLGPETLAEVLDYIRFKAQRIEAS